MLIYRVNKCFDTVFIGAVENTQFITDTAQQLDDRDPGIQDKRNLRIFRQLLEQAPAHRGFAGTDFAGKQYESAIATYSI